MHPHLARNVGEHLMPVIETDFEGGTRERFDDFPLETDEFFIISHILHRVPARENTLPTQKERWCVSIRAFLSLASLQYTLSHGIRMHFSNVLTV